MMKFSTVTTAVSKIVLEAQIQVLEDFKMFLSTKKNIDEVMEVNFKDFAKCLYHGEPLVKKKRQPTLFNFFVKDKIASIKVNNPDIKNVKSIMSMVSEAWKTDPFAIFLKNMNQTHKQEIDNETLYGKAKELFKDSEVSSSVQPVPRKKKRGATDPLISPDPLI